MKILHITTSLENGGAQAILYNLVVRSDRHEHVVVSLMGDDKYGQLLREHSIEVFSLNSSKGSMTLGGFYSLIRFIRATKPDVIQTWMYHADLLGSLAGKMAGVKSIVWGIHNSTLDKNKTSWKTRFIVQTLSFLSKYLPAKIVSCSLVALEIHKKRGYSASKLVFVANGYDLEKFSPDAKGNSIFGKHENSERKIFYFGTVGRWSEQKDQQNLINACQILASRGFVNFQCVLVGPDLDCSNHKLLGLIKSADLQNHVQLAGVHSDIAVVMNSLDFHVLPSAFGEAFPNVVAEAMACGVPNLVTDVGDSALMVGNFGWVVQPRDPETLADRVEEICTLITTDEWQQIKSGCREKALRDFAIARMVQQYSDVWESA